MKNYTEVLIFHTLSLCQNAHRNGDKDDKRIQRIFK
jgi:hypothetical protein